MKHIPVTQLFPLHHHYERVLWKIFHSRLKFVQIRPCHVMPAQNKLSNPNSTILMITKVYTSSIHQYYIPVVYFKQCNWNDIFSVFRKKIPCVYTFNNTAELKLRRRTKAKNSECFVSRHWCDVPTAPARHIKVVEGQGSDQSLKPGLYEGGRLERKRRSSAKITTM